MYVKRVVTAGLVTETKKMYTTRVHTKGCRREKNRDKTKDAQAKVNERKAEENLRWLLNANFGAGDYHIVLHYYDKQTTLKQAEEDKAKFLRRLRIACRSQGIPWK